MYGPIEFSKEIVAQEATKQIILQHLQNGAEVRCVMEYGNCVAIVKDGGEYGGVGKVDHYTVTYLSRENNPMFEDNKDEPEFCYYTNRSQYFHLGFPELAVECFINRSLSENPGSAYWEHGREEISGEKLHIIKIRQTGVLFFPKTFGNKGEQNHYDYLDAILEAFWVLVFGKTPSDMFCGGIVGAHGDKGSGYERAWSAAGISYHHGMLLFLLTYTKEYDNRDKSRSCEWVVENYQKYLPKILEAEKITARDKYGYQGN